MKDEICRDTDSGLAQGISAGEARCRHLPFAECHQGHVLGEEQEVSGMEGQDFDLSPFVERSITLSNNVLSDLALFERVMSDISV